MALWGVLTGLDVTEPSGGLTPIDIVPLPSGAPAFPTTVSAAYDPAQPRIPAPSHGIRDGIKPSVLVQSFDSGHEQRRQKADPRRTFDLQYNVLTRAQYLTIRDFFFQVLNRRAFVWVHPVDKQPFLVRFDMETFTAENFGHGPQGPLYKLQLRLMQVWD